MFLPRLTSTKETTNSTTIDLDLSYRRICRAECSIPKETLAKAMIKSEELARTIHQFGQLGRGAMHSSSNWALLADQILGAAKPLGLRQFDSVLWRFMQNTTLPRSKFRGKRPWRIKFKPLRRNIWTLNRRQILSSHYISLTVRNL
jgi:hypothetical protein